MIMVMRVSRGRTSGPRAKSCEMGAALNGRDKNKSATTRHAVSTVRAYVHRDLSWGRLEGLFFLLVLGQPWTFIATWVRRDKDGEREKRGKMLPERGLYHVFFVGSADILGAKCGVGFSLPPHCTEPSVAAAQLP